MRTLYVQVTPVILKLWLHPALNAPFHTIFFNGRLFVMSVREDIPKVSTKAPPIFCSNLLFARGSQSEESKLTTAAPSFCGICPILEAQHSREFKKNEDER